MVKFWEKIRRTPSNRDIKEKEAGFQGYGPGDPAVIEVQGTVPESECSNINTSSKDGVSLQSQVSYPGSQMSYSGSQVSYPGSQLSYSGSQVSQDTLSTLRGSLRDDDSLILDSSYDGSITGSKGEAKDKKKMKSKDKKKGDVEMKGKELDVRGVGLIPYPDMKESRDLKESSKGKKGKDVSEKDKWVIHIDANKDRTALKSIQRDGKKRTTLERGSGLERPGPEPSTVGKRSTIERGSGLVESKGSMSGSKGSLRGSKLSLKEKKKKEKDSIKLEPKKKESKEEVRRREKEEKEMKKREREEREREEKEAKRRAKEEEERQKQLKLQREREEKEEKKREKERQEREEKEAKKREKEEKKKKRNSKLFDTGDKREPLPTHPEENRWSLSEREKRAATLQAGVQPDVVFRNIDKDRFKEQKKRHSTSEYLKRRSRDFDKQGGLPTGFEKFERDEFRQRSSSLKMDTAPPTRFLVHVRPASTQVQSGVIRKPAVTTETQTAQIRPAESARELYDPNDFALQFLHKNYLSPSKSSIVSPRLAPLASQASEESLNSSSSSSQKKGKVGRGGHLRNDSGSTITSSSSRSSGHSGMKPVAERPEVIRKKAYHKWSPERQEMEEDAIPVPKFQPSIPTVSPKVGMSFPDMKYAPDSNVKSMESQMPSPKRTSGSFAVKGQVPSPNGKSSKLVKPSHVSSSPKRQPSISSKDSSPESPLKPKTDVVAMKAEFKTTPLKESRIPKPHTKSPEQKLEDSKCIPETFIPEPQVRAVVFEAPPQSVDMVLPKTPKVELETTKVPQPVSSNIPAELDCVYNIPEVEDVNLHQMTPDSKIQYNREKVTSTLTRTSKIIQPELGEDTNGSDALDTSVDSVSSTNSNAQGTPTISMTNAPVLCNTPGPTDGKVRNILHSHIPLSSKEDGTDDKKKTRETISVACDTNGAIETTFGADFEFIDTDSSIEEPSPKAVDEELNQPVIDFVDGDSAIAEPSPKDVVEEPSHSVIEFIDTDSSIEEPTPKCEVEEEERQSDSPVQELISPEDRRPKFVQLDARLQKESEVQVPKGAVRLENGGFTFAKLPEPVEEDVAPSRESPVRETTLIQSQEDQPQDLDQKAPRKSSVSQIKGAHQPDLVSNSIGSRAHAAQEISRLEALCEARTKELNYAKMQLKAGIEGFDAMSIMVQYLTSELDAFSMPEIRLRMNEMQERMQILTTDIGYLSHLYATTCGVKWSPPVVRVLSHPMTSGENDLKVEKANLETMTHDLIQSNKETAETLKEEHRTTLDSLEDRLGVKHEEHIQRLHDQHSEEVKTLKSYHEKHLSEIKTENESASQELLKRQRQQLREIEERDVRHLTELQKQHEAKLYEITHRFEDIKVTLSDKVYTLKAECDELRSRSAMYEQALQRDTDIKVQPDETVHDRLQKMIDEKARPHARASVDTSRPRSGRTPIPKESLDERYIITPDFIGRRKSYALGESDMPKLALLPYRDLPQEIESLKAVLDMKNQEIHDLRAIKIDYEKQLEDLPPARDRIKTLEQKIENLEAIINIKSDYEKQLAEKHHVLMRRYDRESKANKRLSMDNEELMWRLTEDAPECTSPGPGKKIPVPCRSPSNLSDVSSPDGAVKRSWSPRSGPLSPGSAEVAAMISKVPMRRSKSRTNEALPSEKRTSSNNCDDETKFYQTL
ncbi:daf-12-interacting protein 1-like isoform X12 [Lineus longissimus]|uniref:daf-12-interacting protein 1-like isoform X12 n=1 Tax=Lineus longissimus TaxID=88925 RepID=UPI00315C8EF3